jgi:hypothetical protein
MRAFQVFAAMPPEHSEAVFREIAEKSPATFTQGIYAASAAFKTRPQFLAKQPFEKRANSVRRALARVAANPVAEEMLAIYFLECKKEILTEWLDAIGLEHEKGSLKDDEPAEPSSEKLLTVVKEFRAKDDDPNRELLLQAFAAQSAIDWPVLDGLIAEALA